MQSPQLRAQSGSDPWTIFLLTCRKPEIDFRFPLARELAAMGHDVHYTFLKRRPVVTRLSLPSAEPPKTFSLLELTRLMRQRLRPASRGLVFNSTNLVFPGICRGLRVAAGGLWCFDVHDDLLYDHEGWRRTKARLAQAVIAQGTDLAVHAAPTLSRLFPRSHHLGNASDMTLLTRPSFDVDRVLVLASVDGRFDFDFMATTAQLCPAVRFDLYGQVSRNSVATRARLEALVAAHTNIVYHGAYTNAELPEILGRFSVTLAPYVTQSRLTEFIDPLRYYHCLNSGMEVITTDIPVAGLLASHLHLVTSPQAMAPLLERLNRQPDARRNVSSTADLFNWRVKAAMLIDLVNRRVATETAAHA